MPTLHIARFKASSKILQTNTLALLLNLCLPHLVCILTQKLPWLSKIWTSPLVTPKMMFFPSGDHSTFDNWTPFSSFPQILFPSTDPTITAPGERKFTVTYIYIKNLMIKICAGVSRETIEKNLMHILMWMDIKLWAISLLSLQVENLMMESQLIRM